MTRYALVVLGQSNALGTTGPNAGQVGGVADLPPESGAGQAEEIHPKVKMLSQSGFSTLYSAPAAGELMPAQCPIQSFTMLDLSVCFAFYTAKLLAENPPQILNGNTRVSVLESMPK